jgi:hypothetical protein
MALRASWNVSGWSEMGLAFGIILPFAETAIGIVRLCPQLDYWPCPAEASASGMTSASCYHVKENVRILAIVKAILKLREVQRQIFLAHIVVRAEHSALEQRPERFDAVRMDLAAHVLAIAVLDDFMRHRPFQVAIASVFISRDQLNLVADGIAHKTGQRLRIRVLDHLADHVTLAGDRANDGNLTSRAASALLLVPVAIVLFPAHVRLINLDRAEQLGQAVILHRGTNTHDHVPSRAVVAAADLPVDLERADSLLALGHQVDHLKPSRERIVGVLKNRLRDNAESVTVAPAAILVLADPVPRLGSEQINFLALAAWAFNAVGPAHIAQQSLTRRLVAELLHQLRERDVRLSANRLASFNFCVHAINIRI